MVIFLTHVNFLPQPHSVSNSLLHFSRSLFLSLPLSPCSIFIWNLSIYKADNFNNNYHWKNWFHKVNVYLISGMDTTKCLSGKHFDLFFSEKSFIELVPRSLCSSLCPSLSATILDLVSMLKTLVPFQLQSKSNRRCLTCRTNTLAYLAICKLQRKKIFNIGTWAQCYKTVFYNNL